MEQGIPFDSFYSEEQLAELALRADDINHGRNVSQHELIEDKKTPEVSPRR